MSTPRHMNPPSPIKRPIEVRPVAVKEERQQAASPGIDYPKNSRVFHEMLANLGKEKVPKQQPSRSPLRDETKRVLNSYYPNNGLMAHVMAEKVAGNTQKDAWSSRLRKGEENKIKIEQKKVEIREKSGRKTANSNASNTNIYKESIKSGWKQPEKPKLSYPLKRPAVEDKLKYDKGEFTRYLERK